MGRVAITLKRSLIGSRADQRQTIRALGLRRVGHSVEHTDSADIRGMINKVRHLVVLEEKK
jgi:large subunit ribosomal protein L30